MFLDTRLSRYLTDILYNLKKKIFTVQNAFSLALLSLFTGFIFGNLFGTFLDTLRLYVFWNGFVGLILLLFIESINSLVYGISFSKKMNQHSFYGHFFFPMKKKKSYRFSGGPKKWNNVAASQALREKKNNAPKSPNLWKIIENAVFSPNKTLFYESVIHIERTLNSFKIGLLFGFFVDSFKVGS